MVADAPDRFERVMTWKVNVVNEPLPKDCFTVETVRVGYKARVIERGN
jgi:hypothetical protein